VYKYYGVEENIVEVWYDDYGCIFAHTKEIC
jgi:hypothetical protein